MVNPNAPTLTLKIWPIQLAIWENQRDGRTFHSAKLSKVYRTEDENDRTVWKNTEYLSGRDWALAAQLLLEANRRFSIEEDVP